MQTCETESQSYSCPASEQQSTEQAVLTVNVVQNGQSDRFKVGLNI